MVRCPECNGEDLDREWLDRMYSDLHDETRYICNDCGCEFREVTNIEIDKHGKQDEEEEECEDCNGTGYEKHGSADEHKCATCKGTGIKPTEEDED